MNVARSPMDLKNDKANEGNAGYSPQEREKMRLLLQAGFVDTFRALHPDTIAYTWWSYMFHAREKNAGWRIDYFLVSKSIADKIGDSIIHPEIMGSDQMCIRDRLCGHPPALLGAAGLPAGGAGLYPHRGLRYRHGALGGGRPVPG